MTRELSIGIKTDKFDNESTLALQGRYTVWKVD